MERNTNAIDGDWYTCMRSSNSILETGVLLAVALIKQAFERAKMVLEV